MYSRFFDTAPSLIQFFIFFCIFGILNPIVPAHAQSFFGVGKKIVDGDSFFISTKRRTVEIRLYGIDCPEYSQPYSKMAKRFVKEKVLHKKLKITPYYKDSYGRLVALVKYGENVLNRSLIDAGFAWVYPRYCKKKICSNWEKTETKARKAKRGLWRDEHPIAPWHWKRNKSK